MNVTLAKFTGWKFIDDGWSKFIVENKNFIAEISMQVFKHPLQSPKGYVLLQL